MIYTEKTKLAMRVAYDAHAGQCDKGGVPYILHPFHVAEQMDDEASTCVALLHDVVEDTKLTASDLLDLGFSDEIVGTIMLLSHVDGSSYFSYIKAIKTDPIARKVKIADIKHNMDVSRVPEASRPGMKKLLDRYNKALEILES